MSETRYIVHDVDVGLDEDDAQIFARLAERLDVEVEDLLRPVLVRRSLDARRRRDVHFVTSYELSLAEALPEPLPHKVARVVRSRLSPARPESLPVASQRADSRPVIVVGAGPAGLFAALALAEAGRRVVLLERGKPVERRMRDIGTLRMRAELDPESNICFGEGGAGTYTDGKLYTRIKHPFMRWVLACFVRFGAPESILVDAHPHLGTDKLVQIVRAMRERILELGAEVRFETRVDDLLVHRGAVVGVRTREGDELRADAVILATGHSARDTYERLEALGVPLEPKPFAVGVRAEHPQELVNEIQLGASAGHPKLGAADYALSAQVPDAFMGKRGVYSFCMCPGGLIVPSPTEPGGMAVNGMSNAKRGGRFANSGLVVQVTPEDLRRQGYAEGPLIGVAFQRALERATFHAAGDRYYAPAMRVTDFLNHEATGELAATSFRPGAVPSDLWQVLPEFVTQCLEQGIITFHGKMRGYVTREANLFGTETRTSSPLRVLREKDMQCVGFRQLYPVGEGAGYAGGIVSAAVDGLKAAAAILDRGTS
ncbi:MAG: FAD-dependent oxidoreductase [Deltaproteobacteria bacterium]|nr:FAD-dependent oxidoreductase [Deltaproteobacteria bacterium]